MWPAAGTCGGRAAGTGAGIEVCLAEKYLVVPQGGKILYSAILTSLAGQNTQKCGLYLQEKHFSKWSIMLPAQPEIVRNIIN